MRWAGHVALMWERIGAYMFFVGKPKEKKQLGRPGSRWEDNNKMASSESGMGAWTGLIWLKIRTAGGIL